MKEKTLLAFLLISLIGCDSSDDGSVRIGDEQNEKILSRNKRFVIFPTGSSFSIAVCMTIGVYGNPQFSLFSWGLNWGFAYELPTNVTHLRPEKFFKRSIETKPMMQRRHRRDLYGRMEAIMREMGYDGRECVLRALCEAPRTFGKKGSHMIAELIRTVFSFPRSKVLPFEHREHMIYDEAHRRGKSGASECHDTYPNCDFSLIKLALGEYSKTLRNFM